LSKEAVAFADLAMRGVGDGVVTLTGRVEDWTGESPRLEVEATVSDASLSLLIKESGPAVPSYLLDGRVDAKVSIWGGLAAPNARFDLALSDQYGFGEPLPLRFRIENGRFRLG